MFCQETPVKVQTAITEHAIICSAKTSSLDIAYLAEHYEKTVLILNIANLVDTTELKKIKGLNAILLAGQAGNATGNIVADVVLGKSIPSGKLTDTWAASYEDYPSSKKFQPQQR